MVCRDVLLALVTEPDKESKRMASPAHPGPRVLVARTLQIVLKSCTLAAISGAAYCGASHPRLLTAQREYAVPMVT